MNCKQCNSPLEDKRPDSIYCNHNCQQKYFKRKQKILSDIRKQEDELTLQKEIIEIKQNQVEVFKLRLAMEAEEAKKQYEPIKVRYDEYKAVLNMSRAEFKKHLFTNLINKKEQFPNDFDIIRSHPEKHDYLIDHHLKNYQNAWQKIKDQHSLYLANWMVCDLSKGSSPEFEELKQEASKARIVLPIIELRLKQLKEIELDRLPPQPVVKQPNGKPKYRPQVRSYSGSEILKMEFETLQLDGELGRFLGKLQRERCAIALTGDSGAGKSTFSYQLAKAFLKKSMNVAYFALETGFTETVKQQIETHKINQYKFEAFSEGTLDDVRLAAPHFDCIIIDSYSKISTKPEDFEALRQEFPKTFFIIIFQKTTDGKIRGGSSIVFNSTAAIDIRVTKSGQRLAVMQKSRYETENFVYSLNNDSLKKTNTTPINWAEFEFL